MTRLVLAVLIGIGALTSVAGARDHTRAYEPLAGLQVDLVQDGDAQKLVRTIESFCNVEHLKPTIANMLPRHGRRVLQIEIDFSEDSNFYGDNFLKPSTFSMHAYSHETEGVWRPIWRRLLKRLADELGEERVHESTK